MASRINFAVFSRIFVGVGCLLAAWQLYALRGTFATYGMLTGVLTTITNLNQIILGFYGCNSFFLLYRSWVSPETVGEAERSLEEFKKQPNWEWPAVTVQLPIFNERYVVKRLLRKIMAFDYPVNKLEIQILDDSTDFTPNIVEEVIAELKTENGGSTRFPVLHLRRANRQHFKAGALAYGTKQANGEFLAIFDADFLPKPDFLKKAVPRFFVKERVGCVQCRWGHLNFNHSMLTKLQAIGHDGHFVVEQHAKSKSGFPLNFNGTAGMWRKQCIEEAGGWSGDTLAEDLDLSYRAQLAGWRIDYLRDVVVPAELPLSISAFKKQQSRWAKGSIQGFLKLVSKVWDSNTLTLVQKFQGTVHLFGYGVHVLMLFNLFSNVCLFVLAPRPISGADTIVYLAAVGASGPPAVVAFAQLYLDRPDSLTQMLFLVLLHHGLCINNGIAVLQAVAGKKGKFERTPKFGQKVAWGSTEYGRSLKALGLPWVEFLIAITLVIVMLSPVLFGWRVNYFKYPWLLFFCASFISICVYHVREHRQLHAAPADNDSNKHSQSNGVATDSVVDLDAGSGKEHRHTNGVRRRPRAADEQTAR